MATKLQNCPHCKDKGKPSLWLGEWDAYCYCEKCGYKAKHSGCGNLKDMKRVAINNWNNNIIT